MAQKPVLLSEEDLGVLVTRIQGKLKCVVNLVYDLRDSKVTPLSIASACGIKDEDDVEDVEGYLQFCVSSPGKIPHAVKKFILKEIQFEASCKHEEEPYLFVNPRSKTFWWSGECKKCSVRVLEPLGKAGFDEIPEPDGDEEESEPPEDLVRRRRPEKE